MGIKCIRKNFYSPAFNFSLFKYNREKSEIEDPRNSGSCLLHCFFTTFVPLMM